nr:hypothetical protein [Tanacetum cinerariifolium]
MMKSKGFFFIKFESRKWLEDVLENGPWMIRNSPLILKKWTMNTRLFKEELNRIPLWVKLHDVPIQVFSKDGRSSFVRCLIEVRADAALKDNVTIAIPLPDGIHTVDKMNDDGFQMVVNKRKSGKTCFTINIRSGAAAGKATWQFIKQK